MQKLDIDLFNDIATSYLSGKYFEQLPQIALVNRTLYIAFKHYFKRLTRLRINEGYSLKTKFLNGTIHKNYAILIPHANANESHVNSDEEYTFGSSLSTLLWIIHAGFIKSVDYFYIRRRENSDSIWKGAKNICGLVETKFIHIFKYMQLNAIKIKQFSLDLDDYEEIWQALLLLLKSQEPLQLYFCWSHFAGKYLSPSLRIEWIGFIFPCNEKLQRRIKTNKLFNGDIKDSLLQILPNIDTDFLELNANRVSIKDNSKNYSFIFQNIKIVEWRSTLIISRIPFNPSKVFEFICKNMLDLNSLSIVMEYDLKIHGWPNKNVEELMVEFNFVFTELDKILEMAQEKTQMLPGLQLKINFVLYIRKYWDKKFRYHCIEDMFKKCILFMSMKKRLDSNWINSITYNGFVYNLTVNDQDSLFKMKNEILEKEFVYMSSIQVNNLSTNLKFSFKE